MSEVKVNKLSPRSGTTITIGDSGDTVTIPSGVTLAPGGDLTLTGALSVDGASATIKLDGNYPVGTSNVALGNTALDDGSLSGGYNTAIGDASMTANTTGCFNTALGTSTLLVNQTGICNVAIGTSALRCNTASNNIAVGVQPLYNNTSGTNNTA